MAEITTPPVSTPAPPGPVPKLGDAALRIVLFGMPAAGKSSLLGAVAQAAQTQEHVLNGRLTDLSQGLAELQRRVYEEKSRPTAEEVVPYPVYFEPYDAEGQSAGSRVEAVLIDCDGRVANDLLARRRTLREDSPDGTLAREVLDADALILAIDAAAPPSQVEADFNEFGRFLRLLERSRGAASEVGGLPVFLVLTKCDLLAGPEDTSLDWVERIEERKRQVYGRFREFLDRQTAEQGPLPFGQVSVHVWATAVKRPPLGPTPARPREPYGVAELFRQAIEQAQGHRARSRRSGWRLFGMVAVAVGVVAAMAAAIVAVVLLGTQERPTKLQNAVEAYFSGEPPTASSRLSGDLQHNISVLSDFMANPDFPKLAPKLQVGVKERQYELQKYLEFRDALAQFDARLSEVRTEEGLEALKADLERIKPPTEDAEHRPHDYAKEWQNTDAMRLQNERRKDIARLRDAATYLAERYGDLAKKAQELLDSVNKKPPDFDAARWSSAVNELFSNAETVENKKRQLIPGSTLTYAAVSRFRKVEEARQGWETVRKELGEKAGVKMGAALGLYPWVPASPPLLVFDSRTFQFSQCEQRLALLKKAYGPGLEALAIQNVPAALLPYFRQASAEDNYAKLINVGRQRLVAAAPDVKSTDLEKARGELDKLRKWLGDTKEFDAFRQLAAVLGPVAKPDWRDPVEELVRFLEAPHFLLNLGQPALAIRASSLEAAGPLKVYHNQADLTRPTVTYDLGAAERTGGVKRYRPTPAPGSDSVLKFQPGDSLFATLEVKNNGAAGWALTWARSRNVMYRFDALQQEPLLSKAGTFPDKNSAPEDVALSFTPPVPRLPDLLP